MPKSILYLLTNPAMPGYVKVGITDDISRRISDLDTTSVPLPFKCFYAAEVQDAAIAEKLLLSAYADQRVRSNREWLLINPERVVSAIRLHPHKEITPSENMLDVETLDDIEEVTRRSASTFEFLKVPKGAILTLTRDSQINCLVEEKNIVIFQGDRMSTSAAALKALRELGYEWSTVNGYQFWEYNGETLTERRTRMEEEGVL